MRAWTLWLLPCSLTLLWGVACGGTNTAPGFADAGGSSGGGSGGLVGDDGGGSGSGGGGLVSGDASGSGSGGGNGCSGAATDYVYVLSAENALYSFAPNLKQFTKIGTLGCQTAMQPNSMAVDRNADAYVNYFSETGNGGAIYKVSTQDASCNATPEPAINMPAGWYQVGMGYSTVGTSTAEALYVDGIGAQGTSTGSGLGLVDFGINNVGPIGPFSGQFQGIAAELTGTGDGRLFGFFVTNPVYVAQIDKSSGATSNPVPMTGLQTPMDWAFSFWGGHFYLYTSQGMLGGGGSDVTDYDPTTGTINTTYMTSIGFDIVGAGVSTCAPVVMPQ
jgi:hypothetical protein